MKIIYTDQSIDSLEEMLRFLLEEQGVSEWKVESIKEKIIARVNILEDHPQIGQIEPYLRHLNQSHRRLLEGYIKIIYRIQGEEIYITDFFDARQDPSKMKG